MSPTAIFVFALYCLLDSSAWILTPVPPSVRMGLYAVVGFTALASRGRERSSAPQFHLKLAVVSVMLIAVPIVLTSWAGSHTSGLSGTLVFALAPVFTVLAMAHSSRSGVSVREAIAPALLGLGGLLLIVPFDLPRSVLAQLSICAYLLAAVLVSICGVWAHRLLRVTSASDAIAVICLSNFAFLVALSSFSSMFRLHWEPVTLGLCLSVGVALFELLLFIWLLRELPPMRFSGRFLLIPLFTIVEGDVFVRPALSARMVAGLVGLIFGAVSLSYFSTQEDPSPLSIR